MSKKEKAPKKDKATKKAEKLEKKAARKAQRQEDKKNPVIKAANRVLAINKDEIVDYDIFEALNMKKSLNVEEYKIAHEISI